MQEEEIDLRDYINVMVKRKWIIILTVIIFAAGSIVLSSVMKKRYEACSVIQNGMVGNTIMKSTDIVSFIKIDSVLSANIRYEDSADARTTKIVVQGDNGVKVGAYCADIANAYVAYGNKEISEKKKNIHEEMDFIGEQITALRKDIANIESTLNAAGKIDVNSESASNIISLYGLKENYRLSLNNLIEEKKRSKNMLGEIVDFKMYEPAGAKTSLVGPKKKQTLVISILMGAMAGIFAAFFVEYWKKSG
jgi:uncharacterized protein involved in exopolysaccharide biosynthesis